MQIVRAAILVVILAGSALGQEAEPAWDTTGKWIVDIRDGDTLWGFQLERRSIPDTIYSPVLSLIADLTFQVGDSTIGCDSLVLDTATAADSLALNIWHGIADTIHKLTTAEMQLPCRWIPITGYESRTVYGPATYTVVGGIAVKNQPVAHDEIYLVRDSVWHCGGDGTFPLPTEGTNNDE